MSYFTENNFLQFFHKNYKKDWYNEERTFKSSFKSVENIAKKIMRTDIDKGLDMNNNDDINWRKQYFGENDYILNSKSTFLSFLIISLDDFTIKLLLFFSIILIIINSSEEGIKEGYKEGFLLIIHILIYIFLTSWNDYNLYKKTLNIEKKTKLKKCKVIRNNKLQIISNKNLLVGDILVLNKGDIVEADGFAIKENKIGVDESPLFQGEYKIQYKSSKFEYNKNKKEYICPFIFAGSYIVEGDIHLLVSALGKNIYKNDRIFSDMLNNNDKEASNKIEEFEYYKEIGYYKMKISFCSEKLSSAGLCIYIFFGFILITKKFFLTTLGNKPILSLDFLLNFINELINVLIGALLSIPNSLNMIDYISFLSNENIMIKNNIFFKHKKYPELAFIDTLLILDNNDNFIFKDEKKEEICTKIKTIKKSGINVILVTEKNFENAIILGLELGIITKEEFKNAKKIVNKYIILNKNNGLCMESEAFNSQYGKMDIEYFDNGKEKIKFANTKYFENVISYLKIIAKVKEVDKMILINGLQQIGKKICLAGATMDDLKILKMANISFGSCNDLDVLKDNYGLILSNNNMNLFWKAYIYSSNLNYKINQYIEFFIISFSTSLIINIIGTFIFKNLPLNKYLLIYQKIFVDLIVPHFISRDNSYQKLLTKQITEDDNYSYLNIGFKIFLRGIILLYVMTKGLYLFKLDNNIEYNIWNDENEYYTTILFFILFFMMMILLLIIFIKSHSNIKNTGIYFSLLLITQFFIIGFERNAFKANNNTLSQSNLLKCFLFAFLIIPIDIFAQILL